MAEQKDDRYLCRKNDVESAYTIQILRFSSESSLFNSLTFKNVQEGADPQTIDSKIAEINAKLDEAIVIVPEFSVRVAATIIVLLVTFTILLSRFKGKNSPNLA